MLTDILSFYPEFNTKKYVENIDYNGDVLSSIFTEEISRIISDIVCDDFKDEKVIIWKVETFHIPLLLQFLKHEKIKFICLHTIDEECIKLISSVVTLLEFNDKCIIVKSFTNTYKTDGLVHISVNGPNIRDSKIHYKQVILSTTARLFKLPESENIKVDSINISYNIDNKSRTLNSKLFEGLNLVYERPSNNTPETKLVSTLYSKKASNKSEALELKQDVHKEEESSDRKGDKHPEIQPVDMKNLSDGTPDKGGWIQIDDGIQNLYIIGADHLSVPPRKIDRASDEYTTLLGDYILSLIDVFFPGVEGVDNKLMVQGDNMNLWLQAFTDESFDLDFNYESLETVGDSAFGYFFHSFLYKKYPGIKDSELTALKANVGSKPSLRQISFGFKMDKWVRIGNNLKCTTNIAEDVVEAFCAVLQMVFNNVVTTLSSDESAQDEAPSVISSLPGHGYIILNSFIDFIFKDVNFTPAMFLGPAKTALDQSVQGITKEKGINAVEGVIKSGNTHTHTLELFWTDRMMDFFHQMGVTMEQKIIKVESTSKAAASAKAYHKAIEELDKKGQGIDFLNKLKRDRKMKSYDQRILQKVMRKIKKLHPDYYGLDIYIPKTLCTTKNNTAMLRCKVPNGTTERNIKLHMITVQNSSIAELEKKLLEDYARLP